MEWVAISSSRGLCVVQTLHYDPSVLVALHDMADSFIELCKPLHKDKAVINEAEIVKGRGVACGAASGSLRIGHSLATASWNSNKKAWARKRFLTCDRQDQ